MPNKNFYVNEMKEKLGANKSSQDITEKKKKYFEMKSEYASKGVNPKKELKEYNEEVDRLDNQLRSINKSVDEIILKNQEKIYDEIKEKFTTLKDETSTIAADYFQVKKNYNKALNNFADNISSKDYKSSVKSTQKKLNIFQSVSSEMKGFDISEQPSFKNADPIKQDVLRECWDEFEKYYQMREQVYAREDKIAELNKRGESDLFLEDEVKDLNNSLAFNNGEFEYYISEYLTKHHPEVSLEDKLNYKVEDFIKVEKEGIANRGDFKSTKAYQELSEGDKLMVSDNMENYLKLEQMQNDMEVDKTRISVKGDELKFRAIETEANEKEEAFEENMKDTVEIDTNLLVSGKGTINQVMNSYENKADRLYYNYGEKVKGYQEYFDIEKEVKSNIDFNKEKDALLNYKSALEESEKLTGWQKFWGRILPTSWYKPSETLAKLDGYKEALTTAGYTDKDITSSLQLYNDYDINEIEENKGERVKVADSNSDIKKDLGLEDSKDLNMENTLEDNEIKVDGPVANQGK